MKVAVLGGGLVGRIAAWACMQAGHVPYIYDRKEEAEPPRGFVFLHSNLGLPLKAHKLVGVSQGTSGGYARKVYDDEAHRTSFGQFDGKRSVFSPAEALDFLNGYTHSQVQVGEIGPNPIDAALVGHDRVIWTLPRTLLLPGLPAKLASVAWYKEGTPLPNHVVYNGTIGVPWHRAGSLFGYAFYEFPGLVPGHHVVQKVVPAGLSATGHDDKVLYTGRFGSWSKMLSHETYDHVLDWLT